VLVWVLINWSDEGVILGPLKQGQKMEGPLICSQVVRDLVFCVVLAIGLKASLAISKENLEKGSVPA